MNKYLGKQFLIASVLYLGQVMAGFSMGWPGPMIPVLMNPELTPLENALTEGQSSWVASILFIGSILGPYVSGYLCNAVGRKPCLYLGGTTLIAAYVMLALANHIALIYAGRVLAGFGTGVVFVTNLVYIGEIASTKIRGTLLTLTGFSSSMGTVLAYLVGPFVSYAVTSWVGAALSSVFIIGLVAIVPESPVYQVMAGKRKEAMDNLTSIGRPEDIDEVVAKANEKPDSNLTQLTEMYTIKTNRRAAFIIIVLNILQQMSGIVAVVSFVTVIFDLSGSTLESHISTIIVGVTQLVAGSFAPLLVDRVGRKSLLLFSTACCSLVLVALGTYFYLLNTFHPAADRLQWLSLVALILFFVSYFTGFGIIPNTFIGEMFTDNVRSFGSTFTVTIGWIFGFGVTTAFGYMVPAWGASVTFWIYAGACAIAFFFTVVFVPETKGKSLLEIQEMLGKL